MPILAQWLWILARRLCPSRSAWVCWQPVCHCSRCHFWEQNSTGVRKPRMERHRCRTPPLRRLPLAALRVNQCSLSFLPESLQTQFQSPASQRLLIFLNNHFAPHSHFLLGRNICGPQQGVMCVQEKDQLMPTILIAAAYP